MNWDAIGAVGEILGALAVFVTLVYLAIQVRQAKEQVSRSVQQARNTTFRDIFLTVAQSSQITAVLAKAEDAWTDDVESERALFDKAKFKTEDEFVWNSYHRALWSFYREAIENRNEFTETQLKELERGLVIAFGVTSSRMYFKSVEPINSPTIQFVKSVLDKSGYAI